MTITFRRHLIATPEGRALQDAFDLTIPAGARLGVTGPSGCGKTTLLRQIAQATATPSPSIELAAGRVEYVPQSEVLFPWYSARRNLAAWRGTDENADIESAEELAHTLGIAGVLDQKFGQLSGGERQRVALWILLCGAAQIVLLDEPFTALDLNTKMICLETTSEWLAYRGRTLILVSHDLETLTYLADRILVFGQDATRPPRDFRVGTALPKCREEYVELVRDGAYAEVLSALTQGARRA